MKQMTLLLLFLFSIQALSADNPPAQAKSPFHFGASYVGEGLSVLSGGLNQGSTYEGMANISFSFDTDKAGWWKGGTLLVTGANTHGGTPSEHLIGDFQIASNIEAGDLTYLHECWFRQDLGAWTFIAGLQDLNAEMVSSEYAGLFLNSSFGTHSTIATNVPSPIFPLTSLGFQIHHSFSDKWKLKLALFDGLPEDFDSNPHNLSWKLNSEGGYLGYIELEATDLISKNLPGSFKFGSYYHNHAESEASSDEHVPNHGGYLVVDQTLWQTASGKTLGAFLQASVSPKAHNHNYAYLGTGLNLSGFIPNRPNDALGLGVAHAFLNNPVTGSETTIECTFQTWICPNLYLQPDFQCILNPAGTEVRLPAAAVAMVRFGLEF